MMNRRTFLCGLTLGTLAVPLASEAQESGKVAHVGVLWSGSLAFTMVGDGRRAFLERLSDLGWIEGQNLTIERRYAEGKLDRLPDLAAELVQLKVRMIVAFGTPASLAAKRATATIPIVILAGDPVSSGLVASLARPGGNITGLTVEAGQEENFSKRLELLKEAASKISRIGILANRSSENPPTVTDRLGRLLLVTLEAARVNADMPALGALRSWRTHVGVTPRRAAFTSDGRSSKGCRATTIGPAGSPSSRLASSAVKARQASGWNFSGKCTASRPMAITRDAVVTVSSTDRGSLIGRRLVAEPLQDGPPELFAGDWLRQVRLKARRPHACAARASRDHGDGWHRSSESDMELLKLGEELAPGHFGRREIADDDIGDEGGSHGLGGVRCGDDRARELESRPKEVARVLVIIDHQDVNSPQFVGRSIHRRKRRPSMSHRHVPRNGRLSIGWGDG